MHAFDPSIQVTEGPGLLEFKALLAYRADQSQNKPNSRVSASGAFKRWFDREGSAPLSTLAHVWITGSGAHGSNGSARKTTLAQTQASTCSPRDTLGPAPAQQEGLSHM